MLRRKPQTAGTCFACAARKEVRRLLNDYCVLRWCPREINVGCACCVCGGGGGVVVGGDDEGCKCCVSMMKMVMRVCMMWGWRTVVVVMMRMVCVCDGSEGDGGDNGEDRKFIYVGCHKEGNVNERLLCVRGSGYATCIYSIVLS